jgi:ribosome-binding factor A
VSGRRPARVAQLLQAEIGRLLLHDVRDPRVAGVTVSDVRVTADLKMARVWVRHLAPRPDEARVLQGLERATSFLRAQLGTRLQLRWVPELRFEYDHLVDDAARLERLLDDLKSDDEDAT